MKEDIIQMARQAGYSYSEASVLDFDRLKRFAKLVQDDYSNKHVQRQWVGLTPDDIRQLEKENTVGGLHGDYCPTWDLIESVEAKLKEKNK